MWILINLVCWMMMMMVMMVEDCHGLRVAIIGEGVIGLSTATAILDLAEKKGIEKPTIEIFHHKPFEEILSRNIAGLFRIDSGSPINKKYGFDTFEKLATLWREFGGKSGVQLISGHILSNSSEKLQQQKKSFGNLVYNFRDLTENELYGPSSLFNLNYKNSSSSEAEAEAKTAEGKLFGIHYTAFTSEGRHFCPFLKNELKLKGVKFRMSRISNFEQLGKHFDVVVNAAGLFAGILASDDAGNNYPVRGVLLKVDAPWQKHFLYREFSTITIPVINGVFMGTVKEVGKCEPNFVTKNDIENIRQRYLKLQPSFKDVKIVSTFAGFRPGRKQIRVEMETRILNETKKEFKIVHNYGHGGNGFTLGYGSGLHAAHFVLGIPLDVDYQRFTPPPLPKNSTIPHWAHILA